MHIPLPLIILAIAVISLDNTHFLQSNLAKPVIAGPLIGWLSGDIYTGLYLGVLFQALALAIIPVGATYFPETGIATMLAVLLAVVGKDQGIYLSSALFPLLLVSTIVALSSGLLTILMRRINTSLLQFYQKRGRYPSGQSLVVFGIASHVLIWTNLLLVLFQPLFFSYSYLHGFSIFHLPQDWIFAATVACGLALIVQVRSLWREKLITLIALLSGGVALWLST
jgi:mannose/fructose/N-acetylgalactosamine-specific phosphotransferase system component IIC